MPRPRRLLRPPGPLVNQLLETVLALMWPANSRQAAGVKRRVLALEDRLALDATMTQWAGNAIGAGTINAFLRRLRSSQRALADLIRGDLPDPSGTSGPAGAVRGREVTTDGQQVTLIDLHNLPERAQRFVVGVVLAAETARKEAAGPGSLLFTMIDELNKYAPREGASPVKDVLLDIAERGRSLGIILIGAQQTASEVERRIIANSTRTLDRDLGVVGTYSYHALSWQHDRTEAVDLSPSRGRGNDQGRRSRRRQAGIRMARRGRHRESPRRHTARRRPRRRP